MIQRIGDPVSVSSFFDHQKRSLVPKEIIWRGRNYTINKIGLHHAYYQGNTLYHVFSVSNDSLFFRLVLNSKSLLWKLEEVADEFG